MRKNNFPYESVFHYLEDGGFLERNNSDEIKAAKKVYWKNYRKFHKRSHRDKYPEFTISLEDDQARILRQRALVSKISVQHFIQNLVEQSLERSKNVSANNDIEILQLLSRIQSDVRNISRQIIMEPGRELALIQKLHERIAAIEEALT